MASGKRTYRNADGQTIQGTWRPIFTRDLNRYFLTDRVIYAYGAISCGGSLTNLDGLRQQLASGQVVTTPQDGVLASAHHLATWRLAEPQG